MIFVTALGTGFVLAWAVAVLTLKIHGALIPSVRYKMGKLSQQKYIVLHTNIALVHFRPSKLHSMPLPLI